MVARLGHRSVIFYVAITKPMAQTLSLYEKGNLMKLKAIFSTTVTILFLLGCTSTKTTTNNLTGWVKDSVSRELGIALPLDALAIVQRFQFDTVHPAIIATVKVDQLNGGIFIYQWVDNKYQLQYKKAEPVYNVEYGPGRHIVFESGFTGTGQKNTEFYLVEMAPSFCTEIWSGPASVYNFTSVGPYHTVNGSVQLNSLEESFIYTKINQTFLHTEFDLNKPDSITSHSEILSFRDLPAYRQPK